MSNERDCPDCRVPTGFVTRSDIHRLPSTWQPVAEAPPWVRTGREGPLVACTACGTCWYLFFDPKEMHYTDIFVLPEHALPLLKQGPLDSVWPAVDRGGRFVDGLIQAWFGQAEYELQAAVEGLMHRLERGVSDAELWWRLNYLRSVLGGQVAREAWERGGDPPSRLDTLQPLLACLERTGAVAEKIRDGVGEVTRRLFGRLHGMTMSLAVAPEDELVELLRRTGHSDPAVVLRKGVGRAKP
ncbi:MAG: hypothetical protein AAF533_30670 [Acidobacteriota bacterium]